MLTSYRAVCNMVLQLSTIHSINWTEILQGLIFTTGLGLTLDEIDGEPHILVNRTLLHADKKFK